MDWWLIPAVVAIAVLLRMFWMAVFRSAESTPPAQAESAGVADDDPRSSDHGASVPSEGVDDDDGIWIELDIEPLFPSSQSRQIVDLTEEHDPESTS